MIPNTPPRQTTPTLTHTHTPVDTQNGAGVRQHAGGTGGDHAVKWIGPFFSALLIYCCGGRPSIVTLTPEAPAWAASGPVSFPFPRSLTSSTVFYHRLLRWHILCRFIEAKVESIRRGDWLKNVSFKLKSPPPPKKEERGGAAADILFDWPQSWRLALTVSTLPAAYWSSFNRWYRRVVGRVLTLDQCPQLTLITLIMQIICFLLLLHQLVTPWFLYIMNFLKECHKRSTRVTLMFILKL